MPAPTSGSCIGARRQHGVNPANAGLHATRWPWTHDTLETVVIPAQARTQRLPALHQKRQLPLARARRRSEEHTSELQSLMRISYAVFCLKKKTHTLNNDSIHDS